MTYLEFGLNESCKLQKFSIQTLYKPKIINIYRMFPSDTIGSLDDFFLVNFKE